MEIKNKHFFITGSGRGMGKDFAVKAAKLGAHVHLVNRKENNELEQEIKSHGAASVKTWVVDQLQTKQIDNFITAIKEENQDVDVLINNAGLLTGGLLENQVPDEVQNMLQVNIASLIRMTQGVLPGMLKRNSGVIVNNASVSGIMYSPCATTYCAAKAGVVGFTKALENELAPTNVQTLLLITPGVKTDMFDQIYDKYGSNMDLSFLTSIPASVWADRVFDHIKNKKSICMPSGSNRFGVWLAQHFPSAFGYFMVKNFKR
jgi:short-subunit dehydrogenase